MQLLIPAWDTCFFHQSPQIILFSLFFILYMHKYCHIYEYLIMFCLPYFHISNNVLYLLSATVLYFSIEVVLTLSISKRSLWCKLAQTLFLYKYCRLIYVYEKSWLWNIKLLDFKRNCLIAEQGPFFYVWLRDVSANERRCDLCDIFV